MQTELEIFKICDFWLKYHVRNIQPHYLDDEYNAGLLKDYIHTRFGGIYSLDNLDKAVIDPAVANHLHWRKESLTAEEIRLREEEAKQKELLAKNEAIAAAWIQNECPTALLFNGDLYEKNSDLIVTFVLRNYAGKLSAQALNDAVTTLAGSLVWFSSDPADRELRNQPAPPQRKLSQQAQLDAGMKAPLRKGHQDDAPLVSMESVAKKAKAMLDKERGVDPEAEYRTKAEMISVGNHLGRLDHGATAQLRQIFAKNPDGSINWEITWQKRNEAADNFERLKNRR